MLIEMGKATPDHDTGRFGGHVNHFLIYRGGLLAVFSSSPERCDCLEASFVSVRSHS